MEVADGVSVDDVQASTGCSFKVSLRYTYVQWNLSIVLCTQLGLTREVSLFQRLIRTLLLGPQKLESCPYFRART